jgi:hypothetical protein
LRPFKDEIGSENVKLKCMKTLFSLLFLLCIASLNLSGQGDSIFKNHNRPFPDSIFSDKRFFDLSDSLYLHSQKVINPVPGISNRHFNIVIPEIKDPYDKIMSERFPGSDRYYAKRPELISHDINSFNKKPDTTVKYYLIIRNPVTLSRDY